MKTIVKRAFPPMIAILTALAIAAAFVISLDVTAEGTELVSGNTSTGENQPGWMFNRDVNTATALAFTHEKASLGIGSLYAGPITNTNYNQVPGNNPNSDKFVAEYFPTSLAVSDFRSFSYDYLIGAGGETDDVGKFYVNIYANIDDSDNYYDCRFDYVAKVGSKEFFTKVVIYGQDAPSFVAESTSARATCPQTLEQMPEGSYIRAIALNMGDTTDSDTGLDAYFDNVEVAQKTDFTVFNFEPRPRTKADCSGDGWKQYRFKNQGQCMKSL